MAVKFFSEDWCKAAMEVINNNEKVYQGFNDPSTFTHKMYLRLLDGPESTTYFTFEQGKLTEWTTKEIHDLGEIDFGLGGRIEHFREAAEGTVDAVKLFMGGKLKILDGNLQLAIQNAGAFNNFLLSFGQVDTDWDI
jgi:putative sterol carrier protein